MPDTSSMPRCATPTAATPSAPSGWSPRGAIGASTCESSSSTSQESAHAAVDAVLAEAGRLDVVVHNAGHMSLGYLEAFTVEELAHQFDVNAFSVQRVNRAALPHMRERGQGTLVYVGSTTTVSVPPFMGPTSPRSSRSTPWRSSPR